MAIILYLKLLTKVGIKRIGTSFLSYFGLFGVLLKSAALFLPETLNFGWKGYFGLVIISLILAIIQRFPRRSFCSKLSSPDSVIEIKIGDIFNEKDHLVIGANDVFDEKYSLQA